MGQGVTYDELCKLGTETSNVAKRAIRDAFHHKWGYYFKCAACGGRIEAFEHNAASLTGTRCIYGDHLCVVISNGYSYPHDDIERKIRTKYHR